ncbi:hypothetical protein A4D02_36015 [Niastella koreensis]|uniref:Uncharacterized protein n=2 Tax=Niastella koreensis TaxID=354356 RepID=G8THP1_NIAKG|nr:hypothetical protein [Niastella koreensis]AEV97469.1 hypothetical protein Niako_1093 [Niastella koreensis GR20-10]AEW01137.1 hypothetical protein Niako_4897 [Niastella koreensis GR20-10]OQP40670.1 hypothetical protein A4D02_36120 [Niastella koreensis]OQP41853.1 hypothetical protein A4D02_36015 [Niastella koreensis]
MTTKNSKLYHLFLVLAILNFAAFYLLAGKSVLTIHSENKGTWDDKIFNYYISISILILLIWLSYWIVRKKPTSRNLTLLHIFITFITAFILPEVINNFFNPMPRRYLDYGNGFKFSDLYGEMTLTFWIVGILLLTSELLLITNLQQQAKKTALLNMEF